MLRPLCTLAEDVPSVTDVTLARGCSTPLHLVATSETYRGPQFEDVGMMSNDDGDGGDAMAGAYYERIASGATSSDSEDEQYITVHQQALREYDTGGASDSEGQYHDGMASQRMAPRGAGGIVSAAARSAAAAGGLTGNGASAAQAAAMTAGHKKSQDPQWYVCDQSSDGSCVRYVMLYGPPRSPFAPSGTLVTFENYAWGAKVDRQLYDQAIALYQQLLPLLLDHMYHEEDGEGAAERTLCLAGEGSGGSLAILLTLMLAARGVARLGRGLLPTYALDAPPPLAEVPHFYQYCQSTGEGEEECQLLDEDDEPPPGSAGLLAQLQLPEDAIKVVSTVPPSKKDTGLYKHIGQHVQYA